MYKRGFAFILVFFVLFAFVSSINAFEDNRNYYSVGLVYHSHVVYIRNTGNGEYIQNQNGQLSLGQYTGADYQKWHLLYSINGSYQIVSMASNTPPATPSNQSRTYAICSVMGFTLIAGLLNNNDALQYFNIQTNGTDFRISLNSNNYYLYASGNSILLGSTFNNSDYQKWEIIDAGNPSNIYYNSFDKINESNLLDRMNCYAAAVAKYDDDNERLQMGQIYSEIIGLPFETDDYYSVMYNSANYEQVGTEYRLKETALAAVKELIVERVRKDLYAFGYGNDTIQESSAQEIVAGPWRKVALVIDYSRNVNDPYDRLYKDYHWYYIDNSGSFWNHKPGFDELTNKDSSGNTIYNPENCSKKVLINNTSYSFSYEFVGYYKIKADGVIKYAFRNTNDVFSFDNAGDTLKKATSLGAIGANGCSFNGKIEYCGYDNIHPINLSTGITDSVSCDIDCFEFVVSQTGYYSFYSGLMTPVSGFLFENSSCIASNIDYLYYSGFRMDYVYLIADEIYILCVSGDSCQTETDYTVTVSHN